MSTKRRRSPSPTLAPATSLRTLPAPVDSYYRSTEVIDRSSTFVGLYSPVSSTSVKSVQSLAEFSTASHRIAAWRRPSKQQSLPTGSHWPRPYDSGHDKYAGKRLERLLENMNIEGVVVVARWYGGFLLGPVRFVHIENCAKAAIGKWTSNTIVHRTNQERHCSVKRRPISAEDDERERARLTRVLAKRDHSIDVLRELLAAKQRLAVSESSAEKALTAPEKKYVQPPVYNGMPVQTLRKLEISKDATIAWVLRKIDEVEEAQKVANKAPSSKD